MASESVSFPYSGLIVSDSYVNDQHPRYTKRPENWREFIMWLGIAGDVPLTALTSQMGTEATDDPIFHWETEHLPDQRATITGVYSDSALSSAMAVAGVSGQTVYVKIDNAPSAGNKPINHFREGHQVVIRDVNDANFDLVGKVTGVGVIGAGAYVAVQLLEDDDNGENDLSTILDNNNTAIILVMGNINPEAGLRPSPVNYRTQTFENQCQIFRTPLEISGTALKTKLRNEDKYQREKKSKFRLHSMELEKDLIWGIKTTNTVGNKSERTTRGIVSFIRENAANNVSAFNKDTAYAGAAWTDKGDEWLDEMTRRLFKYTPGDLPNGKRRRKVAFCGSGALLGLQKLIRAKGEYQINATTSVYGLNAREWLTPFGSIELVLHPFFNQEETNSYSLLVIEPDMMVYRPLRDTMFKPDVNKDKGGGSGFDGLQEEFLTEAGLELHHPLTFGYLNGVGQDNTAGGGAAA